MKRIIKHFSISTWLNTIASLITIISWFGFIEFIKEAHNNNNIVFLEHVIKSKVLFFSLAIFVHLIFWTALISLILSVNMRLYKSNRIVKFIHNSILLGFGYIIGLLIIFSLYDISGFSYNKDFVSLAYIFPIIIPFIVIQKIRDFLNQEQCDTCGKLGLEFNKRHTRKSIDKEYYSDISGRPFIKIIQYRDNSDYKKCKYCNNITTFSSRKNLGSNKYSLCSHCNYYPLDFVKEYVMDTREYEKIIETDDNKKKKIIIYELIKLVEKCPKCNTEYTWRKEKIIKEIDIPNIQKTENKNA